MPPEPNLHSRPPVHRLLSSLSWLGSFLLLLLAGQGCGYRQFERAFARGVDAMRGQDYDLAIAAFSEVIQLKPKYTLAYYNRGLVYELKGDWDRAIADYNEAIRRNPGFADAYYGRGLAYRHKGDWGRALADYNEVIRLKPDFAQAYINLSWLLAVCPDANLRNGMKAVGYAKIACKLSGWKIPVYFNALAVAYAEAGNFDDAVKWETKYFESDYLKSHPSIDTPENARQRLSLFEQKKPYHEENPSPSGS